MIILYSGIHCKIVSALFIVIAVVLLIVLLQLLCFEVFRVSRVSRVSCASLLKQAAPMPSNAILWLYRLVAILMRILSLSL
jgi:hypothetical protein